MSETDFPSADDPQFDQYMEALAKAINYGQHQEPLRGYCAGLIGPGERKSMEPIAARLAPENASAMHQRVHHFVADGAWSDEAVLAAVRGQVLAAMLRHGPIRFWIVDDTGIRKKGKESVGVARQYCGEVGKIDNCQVLVSLSVANDVACLPVAAGLYLPEAWAEDETRRAKVGVPLDVTFQTKPEIALDQIRRMHTAGVAPGIVLADEAYGRSAAFRQGIAALDMTLRSGGAIVAAGRASRLQASAVFLAVGRWNRFATHASGLAAADGFPNGDVARGKPEQPDLAVRPAARPHRSIG